MKDRKLIETNLLVKILVDAVLEESYINSEELTKKFRSLIKSFRIDLSTRKYEKMMSPHKAAKLRRQLELDRQERNFWKAAFERKSTNEEMQILYKELDAKQNSYRKKNCSRNDVAST